MVFYKLSPLIKKSLKAKGLDHRVEATLICQSFNQEIKRIFGQQILKEISALYYKNHTLSVKVVSPILAAELRLRQEEILTRLNNKFKDKIKKLQYTK